MKVAGRQCGSASFNSATRSFVTWLCLTAFLPLSRAQDVITITSSPGVTVPSTTVSPSASTLASNLPITLTTTSPTESVSADPAPPDLFPTSPPHVQPVHDASVFNYYFLFLFLFAVLIAILLLWFHRKRQQRKQQLRQNGQHALARDLEGWAGTRRFMHGRHEIQASARREEGLNEVGEAPPPYEVKGGGGVEVPLQAVVRDERAQQPPEYDVTDHGDASYNVGRRPGGA